MLNLPAFILPVVLNAEEVAASRELVSSACKYYISSRCFSSVQLNFDSVYPLWVIATDQVVFYFHGSNLPFPGQ